VQVTNYGILAQGFTFYHSSIVKVQPPQKAVGFSPTALCLVKKLETQKSRRRIFYATSGRFRYVETLARFRCWGSSLAGV
jgi:hypothetical protein